jgi:glycine cleavage system aminomethyltransferase T
VSNSIHADGRATLRVSARRFEQSPFQHRWLSADTIMGVYAGRYYATNNGEDVDEAYWALRRAAVLYDVPERPVEISGPDAARFLDHVFSRRVAEMDEGRARYAIACTDRGRLFMDGVLFRLGQERFWYVQPDGALETWLLAHSPGFDVAVTDPHARVLQIQGPTALRILAAATDGALDERLAYFRASFGRIADQEVYISRTGWTGEIGFEIYTQGDATDCDRVWDRLLEVSEPHGMILGSLASMEIRRIEAGILDNGTDFDLTMTPFEAGLGAFIDLDKPAFIGRDALLAADRTAKRLFGLKCPDATPGYGAPILDNGTSVGHVTAGAWSPYLQSGIGYARFDTPSNWAGRDLTVGAADGTEASCRIIDLPFYDADKRIPRGLTTETP